MISCAVVAFVEALRHHRLLSPKKLAGLRPSRLKRFADVRDLAKVLIRLGWLTVYQVNRLLAGRACELVIGPYHVLDRLGQGGQSQVFKARHTEFGWVVALKVLRSQFASDPGVASQFLQEMEAMAKLNHPNVVEFCDADQFNDTFYCALEYIEGTDLGKYVALCGPLPVAEACEYIRQTALGLQHAHEHHLIHRDIKPGNLLLTCRPGPQQSGSRLIKILDWGLADLRPPQSQHQGAASHANQVVIGTADYLSPEQARNADTVDIRGDIYSLGCVFYFLLSGRPPFPGGSLARKLLQHQHEEPTPLQELRFGLPPALVVVVKRMMAKRPENRFQTPAAIAAAVAPFCRSQEEAPLPATQGLHRQPVVQSKLLDDTPMPRQLLREQETEIRGQESGVSAEY
jgi:serine/threonine-protein kinase